jgi:epidermal growth factor receptor substrate 15
MSSNFVPTTSELALVNQIFAQADTQGIGIITGDVAVKVFQGAKLSPSALGEIWSIADDNNDGFLTKKGVSIAVRLMGHAQKGQKVDRSLVNKREIYYSFTLTHP